MEFDIENNRAYFDSRPDVGQDERDATGCPPDWKWVGLDDLAAIITRRRIEIEAQKHEGGSTNFKAQGILQMIDADLYQCRPDLYQN